MKSSSALFCLLALASSLNAADWGRFRGPNGTGLADTKGMPKAVDEGSTVWKIELGKGWSSPVLWKNLVIVTAETGETTRAVIALDSNTGKEKWRHEVPFAKHQKHNFNSFASSSPYVDATGIYVNWSTGTSIEALALDHSGKVLWTNPHVADYIHEHGTGVSAVVADGIMIVRSEFDWQRDGKAYTEDPVQKAWKACIVGLDAKTGKQAWKLEVPNTLNTFSTPLVRKGRDGGTEFVCADTASGVFGIDAKTGTMKWQHNPGYKQRSLGSPVLKDDILFCTFGQGGGGKETAAINLNEAKPTQLYDLKKSLPYVPTPLVIGDYMYLLGDGGILQCVEFKTGKPVYEERLNGSKGSSKFFSSPVAADGKIYCGSQMGDVIVVKAGPKFEQLSASHLDSPINSTFALGDGRVYIRTEKMLYCAGAKAAPLP